MLKGSTQQSLSGSTPTVKYCVPVPFFFFNPPRQVVVLSFLFSTSSLFTVDLPETVTFVWRSCCLFLFVPFLPWLPARRLAAPCVKGGCSRTDCGNSRLASPGPLLPIQRGSHQSSAPPCPSRTHQRPTKHTLT